MKRIIGAIAIWILGFSMAAGIVAVEIHNYNVCWEWSQDAQFGWFVGSIMLLFFFYVGCVLMSAGFQLLKPTPEPPHEPK